MDARTPFLAWARRIELATRRIIALVHGTMLIYGLDVPR